MTTSIRVAVGELGKFCLELLTCHGVRYDVAHHVAEGLVHASLRGVDSHGVRLLPHYLRAVKAGRLNPEPTYRFEATSPGTGRLDGDHTFGHAAGAEGMRHAIELAREAGIGAVTVSNSSHFGAAACFALMAAGQGMIGFSFTHADSLLLSFGGRRSFFGTNPICFAAPCSSEEPLCLDMATSLVTWNKVLQVREREGNIPPGWGADEAGHETQDAERLASLFPIGGYKGFGLSLMVDVLCGLLTRMPFGHHISRMYADPIEQRRYLGHFFMAIDISRFVPLEEFKQRMQQMMEEVRSEPPRDPGFPVLVPGDPEKRAQQERLELGVPFTEMEMERFRDLGQPHGLTLSPVHLKG